MTQHLYDLINERGRLLDAALDSGAYPNGYERTLADEVIGQLAAAQRKTALEQLAHDKLHHLVMVDCLLDECAPESYTAIKQMAEILVAAIHAGNDEAGVLHLLVVDAIDDTARVGRALRTPA